MRIVFAITAFLVLAATGVFAETSEVKVGSFAFTAPDGWTQVTPSSPMRKAQLEIARGPEKAEVTFFHFGKDQGGSTAENVARWFAQFPGSEDKRITENVQAGPVKITFAMTEGTFSSGMPGGPTTPMTGYALCGAILEGPDGSIFVKMTGPEAIVKASTEAFKKMVTDAAKTGAPRA
ncbi:MAG TPA: hypothetical protein VEX43_16750 [Chthoniobacterales bacterium]|nr:hypothetical protein [Chthoniobacterales bacterium]